jgi:predicted dehydrogenase/threonine dehydrogenase-like Zn-dependent dehydrogenase
LRQVFQSLKTGEIQLIEVPAPMPLPGQLLIRTRRSVVSVGTERSLVNFGKASYLQKARQQPEKVRQVLEKVKTDGLLATLEAVRRKLDEPMALGYCNAGVVVGMGAGVTGFQVGDRVVSNGKHAELVSVPVNLCARIPEGVPDETAAFTVLSSIALQGIRLIQPTLGETVAVMGLGLIGQLAVQLLRAHGCRVIGMDFDPVKLALARQAGAEVVDLAAGVDPVAAAVDFSRGQGVDAVLVTASTDRSEPIHQAAGMSRKRGRIVLVGVTGLELQRSDFYEKELTFQVSCSYGPGRYDSTYEEGGSDYPLGFVRWTEQRNFEAVLDMMAIGNLQVESLITHRFPLEAVEGAYRVVAEDRAALGIVLSYPDHGLAQEAPARSVQVAPAADPREGGRLGFIGAGNYAGGILIPAFKRAGGNLQSVASAGGASAVMAARRWGFSRATTEAHSVILEPEVDAVVVATRHDSHARWTTEALQAGKAVFVEKPLALTRAELDHLEEAHGKAERPLVMVGFNRRFSPFTVRMRELLSTVPGSRTVLITVNAGAIPASHWTQDPAIGGGRILGEACHFVDLARCLVGSPIRSWQPARMGSGPTGAPPDSVTLNLTFEDGSLAVITYLANGHRAFPKERVEVFAGGRVLQLDNFRVLRGFGWPGFTRLRTWRQDKGQEGCARAFLEAVRHGLPAPIPWEELLEVGRVTLAWAEAVREG